MNNWLLLRNHILNHGIIFGDQVEQRRYGFFLDTRQALQQSGYLKIAGQLLWEKIREFQPQVIIGTGLGAVNLLCAVQIAAEEDNYQLNTLIVRDAKKPRNRQRRIEGPSVKPHSRAFYIDDAFNTGRTFNKFLNIIKEERLDLDLLGLAILFDFWNPYGTRRLEVAGLPVYRIYTRHDFGITRIDPKSSPVEGRLLWRNLAYNQWSYYLKSPPMIINDLIIFANDRHEVYCHNIDSGEIIWQWQGPHPFQEKGISARPIIDDHAVYISCYDGFLYKLDLYTGQVIWKTQLDMYLHSTPYIYQRMLYIGTEGGLHKKRGDILALDTITGQILWRFPTKDVIPASPTLFQSQVICGSNDGKIYSITNGRLNWSVYVGIVKGRPAVIEDSLFVCTEDGHLYALDPKGRFIWHRTCGTQTLHQFLPSHPSGLIYIINQDHFCLAYDKTGNQIWARKLRGPGLYNISINKDELFICCENGYSVILDAISGEKLQQSWFPFRINCPPNFNDKILALHSVDKGLYVYERLI